ncbi:unnamed protein product [Auanema sp. JU1783]|nr:unnamed protein product [Auanema sp. JU1783]
MEILTTAERFEELGLLTNDSNMEVKVVRLKKSSDSEETPFVIPAITFDDFCSGNQELEIGRNVTFSCMRSLDTCNNNSYLSIDHIVGQSYLLDSTIGSFQIRKPVWINGTCHDVLKEIKIVFIVNNTEIIDCIIGEIEFTDAKTNFQQTYSIQFIDNSFNETNSRGYKYGDQIITDKNNTVLIVPSVGYCSKVDAISIRFLQRVSTGCFIRAQSCKEAQSLIQQTYDAFSSDFIMSELSGDSRRVPFLKRNISFPAVAIDNLCSIVSSYKLKIAYAKQGFEHDFYLLIVAFTSNYKLSQVPFITNQTIHIPFHFTFQDVTQAPLSTFAALPHINLRLPSDFFFPFISSETFTYHSFSSFFVLLYYFAYS